MTSLSQRHVRAGAIRIEYLIAGAICIALLIGMTAVLVRYSRMSARFTTNRTPQPIERFEPSGPVEPDQPQGQPQAQPPAQQPQQPQQPVPTPPVVVAPQPQPQPVPTPTPAASAQAYPLGEPKVIATEGKTRIEAENYDLGGEKVSYHDTTAENSGGTYRTNEGVDISLSQDPEGEHVVTDMHPGEWLNFTIRVVKSGPYAVSIRAASAGQGPAQMRVLFNGKNAGTLKIASTGGEKNFVTTTRGVQNLVAGDQVMRIEILSEGLSLDWIEFDADAKAPAVVTRPTAIVPQPTQPSPPPSSGNYIVNETFKDIALGQRPVGNEWTWSATGSITVQEAPGAPDRVLRLVDANRASECYVRQGFAAHKGMITWHGRVRFVSALGGFGISLFDADKSAVLIRTTPGEIGYEDKDGKWQRLVRFEANTWYDLRIDADTNSQTFRLYVNNAAVGDGLGSFRNNVTQIDAWMAGTSGPLTSTMFIDEVKVEVR